MKTTLEGNQIKVEYNQMSGDSLDNGWIGMFPQNHENNWSYLSYKRIRDFTDRTGYFDCPVNGTYVFKLFPRNGWTDKYVDAQSAEITINNIDSIHVEVRAGNMIITVCLGSEHFSNMMVTINHLCDRDISHYFCYSKVLSNGTSTIVMPVLRHKLGQAIRASYMAYLCTKHYDPRACKAFDI